MRRRNLLASQAQPRLARTRACARACVRARAHLLARSLAHRPLLRARARAWAHTPRAPPPPPRLYDASVVKITEYQVNFVQDRKILILLQGEPVQHPSYALGTPTPLVVLAGASAGAGAEQPDPAPYGAASGAPGAGGYGAASSSSSSSSSAAVVRTPAAYGYGAGAGGGAASQTTPISALNPYVNRWTIKVRVTSKSDVRTWSNPKSSGSMFKVELLDEAGSEIGAAFFKEAVAKFFDTIQVGGVYYMGGGKVKVADPKVRADARRAARARRKRARARARAGAS